MYIVVSLNMETLGKTIQAYWHGHLYLRILLTATLPCLKSDQKYKTWAYLLVLGCQMWPQEQNIDLIG